MGKRSKTIGSAVKSLVVYRLAKDFRAVSKNYKGRVFPGFGPKSGNVVDEARSNWLRVWAHNFGGQSRYSDGRFPVLYTAPRRSTCYSEVGFHAQNDAIRGMPPGAILRTPYVLYKLRLTGRPRDLMRAVTRHAHLCAERPSGYSYCNRVGRAALKASVDFLVVPSARSLGYRSVPVLSQSASSSPLKAWPVVMIITSDLREVGIEFDGRRPVRHKVHRPTTRTP